MARVKRGVTAHARHKKVIKQAKGYRGRRKNTFKVAKQAVEKSMQYAYRDRRVKKKRVSFTLDTKNKCWSKITWNFLFSFHEWS